ncbi:MAG TPA: outer membrane beta-barrel protein [Bacteroidales bacterium]|nr:outer membrane beta-barrel protein [Bacteroidales bacterium]HPI86452.1 outer membrane beta-barrel protein [Bacteroidales bacterium]HPM92598.1 outer membrane beta-barrel protein [Bacteroidales bacterium]
MKKTFLFLLLFSFIATTGFAQLELKPAVGLNVARFDSDPVFSNGADSMLTNPGAGFQLGASLAIGRKLYVEPGVFYSKMVQGFETSDIEKEDFTYSANYIRVPLNFGFKFIGTQTSLAGLKIFLGPSMFIPLSIQENTYPIAKTDVKSPLFDFNVGAGLTIWNVFLDVSYGWGLSPQFKDDPIEAKMQAFYANVGFRFKLINDEE